MVRAVGENSFQPKIGFKTRYGLVANPFAEGDATNQGLGRLRINSNRYYRRVAVKNLMWYEWMLWGRVSHLSFQTPISGVFFYAVL